MHKRYLYSSIISDLEEKMVFVGGPRQVGKTTLAKYIGEGKYKNFSYLNWDSREDRKNILDNTFDAGSKLLIFDEIHKYKQWKNYLKGEFDKNKDKYSILATGSARMDVYKQGGDSLMGRYHYYRLHPFSLRETSYDDFQEVQIFKALKFTDTTNKTKKNLNDLMEYGGFPEPFIKKEQKVLRRFHNERLERLVKEDIRDLSQIRDLSALQILTEILPGKVGSLLSINSLSEDLQATHKTISAWMDILEKLYYHYRIYPFSFKTIKSLRKEPKMYLWDWSQIEDEGIRFENMIASHLLKLVHFLYDNDGYKAELFFLRDIDQRETDFLITIDKKPWLAVETKIKAKEISKPLNYFSEKLNIPFSYQVVQENGVDYNKNNIRVISAEKFLNGLI